MSKIPTAEEFYKQTTGCVMNHRDVKTAMIEFTKLHVEAALKEASEKAELDYHNGSCRECGSNKIDEKSILNAYDLNNIK